MLARARFLISNLSYFFNFLHFFVGFLFFREFRGLKIASAVSPTPNCLFSLFFYVPTRLLETFFQTCASEFCTFHLNWSSTHSHTQTLVESSWKFSTRRKKFFRAAFFLLAVSTQFAAVLSRHCHVAFFFFAFLFLLFAVFFSGWKYFTA